MKCNVVQCNALQCTGVWHDGLQCTAMQWSEVEQYAVQFNALVAVLLIVCTRVMICVDQVFVGDDVIHFSAPVDDVVDDVASAESLCGLEDGAGAFLLSLIQILLRLNITKDPRVLAVLDDRRAAKRGPRASVIVVLIS